MTKASFTKRSFLSAVLLVAACGGNDDGQINPDADPLAPDAADGCPTPNAQRLLPLAIGNTWTFEVTKIGNPTEIKASTVEALEDVGGTKAGVTAFKVRTEKLDGATVSWQEDLCDSVVRHREKAYDLGNVLLSDQIYQPRKLRVDETAAHTTMGATWVDVYTEIEEDPTTGDITTTEKSESWTVEAASESVTVPAGTFDAIRLLRTGDAVGAAEKRYWFAPGVGKVKEEGDQTEELTEYTVQ